MLFAFQAWQDRDGHHGLRDAWLASQAFIEQRQWQSLRADCTLCGRTTRFELRSNPDAPDLREGLACARCGLNARVRAALSLLQDHLRASGAPAARTPVQGLLARLGLGLRKSGAPQLYVTEQATPTYAWMQRNLAAGLHGSEFEPDPARRAMLTATLHAIGGSGEVQFRDVTALDFADAALDAVVSFDVLEHVPDYHAAIGEFARVLKPGGLCVATFPFNDQPRTLVRARLDQAGGIEHIEPPEYHGDPIGGGILCYYHFGWDVLQAFRDAGFADARMVMPFSLEQGLPYGMWTLLATR